MKRGLTYRQRLCVGMAFVAAVMYVALFCGGCADPNRRFGRNVDWAEKNFQEAQKAARDLNAGLQSVRHDLIVDQGHMRSEAAATQKPKPMFPSEYRKVVGTPDEAAFKSAHEKPESLLDVWADTRTKLETIQTDDAVTQDTRERLLDSNGRLGQSQVVNMIEIEGCRPWWYQILRQIGRGIEETWKQWEFERQMNEAAHEKAKEGGKK